MLPVETAFKTYTDLDGKPLQNGYVYFGVPGQDPMTHPVTVYWDADGTLQAEQPLRTVNGYIMNAGTPANVFYDGPYSELVKDAKGRQVHYARTSEAFSIATVVSNFLSKLTSTIGASLIGFVQSGAGAIKRWVQDKLRETVSIADFGAVGDGDAGSAAANGVAIQNAINALKPGQRLYYPPGVYYTDRGFNCAANGVLLEADADNGAYYATVVALFTGGALFTMSGNEQNVRGLGLLGSPTLTTAGAGATNIGIRFTGDSGGNIDGNVRNCGLANFECGIETSGRNINVRDNLFANSKNGFRANGVTTGQCRDFVIQRNRFHHMGDVPGSTFCISFPSTSAAYEAQIQDNLYDGQAYAMFLYGQCDQCQVTGNRISLPKYRWIDIKGNIVRIADNSFEGNGTGATGFGIAAAGSDVAIVDNTLVNAPYQAIVLSGVDRFKVADNSISNASNMAPATYDAIVVDATCTNGKIDDNHIINTDTSHARYGISGNAGSTTAHDNTFANCALGNVNSTTFYNVTPTAYGRKVEGTNGALRSEGAKYRSLGSAASADVAYVDFDSDYGACLLEVSAALYGSSAAQAHAVAKRYVAFVAGVPVFTTVGTDDTNNCSLSFAYVSSAPNRIKVTLTNGTAQTLRGGVCIDLKGGGSNASGKAGATLTML